MRTDPMSAAAGPAWYGDDQARSLCDREVHVWVVPLPTDVADDRSPLALLSRAERATMARFASLQDRRRYGLSHAAARRILATYVGRAPAELGFERGPAGKPHLTDTDVQHSLSHGGGVALLGVGRQRPLGVDVEVVRPLPAAEGLKRACFTAGERKHLATAGTDDELLRLWTRKEAVVKATGEGLARVLDGFDVLNPRGLPGWRVVDLAPAPGYVGAAAVSQEVRTVIPFGWSWRAHTSGSGMQP